MGHKREMPKEKGIAYLRNVSRPECAKLSFLFFTIAIQTEQESE